MVTGVASGVTEGRQGQHLTGGVPDVAGHCHRAAGVIGRLGVPAHIDQHPGPASQGVGQCPARPFIPGGITQPGEVAQRPGQVSGEDRRPAQPGLRGTPLGTARPALLATSRNSGY